MVQVDLPAAFAIGQAFAYLSKNYLQKESSLVHHRLLGPFNLFMSCCYAPVGMFLLIAWPAWEIMYVTDWLDDPYDKPFVALFYVAFAIIMILLGNIGFMTAHYWLRINKLIWVKAGIVIGILLTALPFVLKWGVWMQVGTYDQVAAQQGYSFWEPPFFYGWLGIMIYMFISIAVAGWYFYRYGSNLPQ